MAATLATRTRLARSATVVEASMGRSGIGCSSQSATVLVLLLGDTPHYEIWGSERPKHLYKHSPNALKIHLQPTPFGQNGRRATHCVKQF